MTPPRDTLIHITDLHFWEIVKNPLALLNKRFLGNANVIYRRRHEFHMPQAAVYGAHLAALGIPECLIGGDFTSTATHKEYEMGKDFVDSLVRGGMNVHLMPGNHDVYTFESVRTRRFQRYFGAFTPAEGYPCRITLPGGTPLILAPTVCPNLLSSAGRITNREIEATRALVDACPEGPILVSGHYPMLHRTAGYTSGKSRQLRNAEALRQALGESGRTILYIAGHVHRFSYTRDNRYPNLLHLTTGAFFLKRPHEQCRGAFSTIATDGTDFSVAWHRFDEGWETVDAEAVPHP
jgi:hypothetical protein